MKSYPLEPVPRRMKFEFTSDIPRQWAGGDAARSQFANAFSILLPGYEALFIKALMSNLGGLPASPELRAQARDFCAQEGQHASVHRDYNRWLFALGYSAVPDFERFHRALCRFQERWFSPRMMLGLAAGGEHMTSFLSHDFLSRPEFWIAGSHPTLAALWSWHAVEEIEHKAVCFDAYQAAGGGVGLRRAVYVIAAFQLLGLTAHFQMYLLFKDGSAFRPRTWISLTRMLVGSGGFLFVVWRESCAYFRKDFHPWETRDESLVATWLQTYGENAV